MLISMYLPMFVFCYRIILTTYKLCNVRLNKTKHFQYLGIVYWSQLGLFLSLKQQDIALSSRRYKYSALHINHCFYLIFSMDQKWLLSTYTKGIINITTFIKKICDSFTKEKNGFFKIRKKPISSFSRRGKNVYYCHWTDHAKLWENCFWHIFYNPMAAARNR